MCPLNTEAYNSIGIIVFSKKLQKHNHIQPPNAYDFCHGGYNS